MKGGRRERGALGASPRERHPSMLAGTLTMRSRSSPPGPARSFTLAWQRATHSVMIAQPCPNSNTGVG